MQPLKQRFIKAGGMCDMLTDQNYAAVEAALTEGTMPTDSRSIVIDYNVLKQNEDMGVGSTVEFYFLGEATAIRFCYHIRIVRFLQEAYPGHGRMALDGATLFRTRSVVPRTAPGNHLF